MRFRLCYAFFLSQIKNFYYLRTMSDKKKLTQAEVEEIKKQRQKAISDAVIVTKDGNT
jgi:hypothetical protein